jgi:hypothetical protein
VTDNTSIKLDFNGFSPDYFRNRPQESSSKQIIWIEIFSLLNVASSLHRAKAVLSNGLKKKSKKKKKKKK